MSRGPVASNLCLLSSLPDRAVGDKVRFLGCVVSYDSATAYMHLGHRYPKGTDVIISVNVELLLPTLASEMTRVGAWINVIGYVKARLLSGSKESRSGSGKPPVHVQALLAWPTGPLDLQRYEENFAAG